MRKLIKIWIICFLLTTIPSVKAESQIPVEVSQVIDQYNGKSYYLHTVEARQTIYAISRAYKVTPESVLIANPAARHGIRINQVLRIPAESVVDNQAAKNVTETENQPPILKEYDYIYHVASNNDRFSYIADIYLVAESSIRQANPNLTEPLNSGVYVKVPISLKEKSPLVAENQFKRNDYDPYLDPLPNQPKSPSRSEAVKASNTSDLHMVSPFEKEQKKNIEVNQPVNTSAVQLSGPRQHVVKPKETAYSIAKSYNISLNLLQKNNPGIANGVKSGQVLVIPDEKAQPTPNETTKTESATVSNSDSLIRHTVNKGETLYSLARNNAVSIIELQKLNPGLNQNLKVGQLILIPKKKIRSFFLIHQVDKIQKSSQLAKDFGISLERLERSNPGLGGRVYPGQELQIPIADHLRLSNETQRTSNTRSESELSNGNVTDLKTDLLPAKSTKHLKVSLLIPLYLEKTDSVIYSPLTSYEYFDAYEPFQFVHFYEGFMLAADSLAKSKGLQLDLQVFDVDQNAEKIDRVLRDSRLAQSNLIIGPFFGNAFEKIAAFALQHEIPIINPVSPRQDIIKGNPFVIKVRPGEKYQYDQVAKMINAYYPQSKVFIFRANTTKFSIETQNLKASLTQFLPRSVNVANSAILDVITERSLMRKMPVNSYVSSVIIDGERFETRQIQHAVFDSTRFENVVTEYFYSNDSIRSFVKKASVVRPNVLIAMADDNVFAMEFVNKINQVADTFQVKLIGLPSWEKFTNLFIDPLVKMNATFVQPVYVDYNNPLVQVFREQFVGVYGFEPERYAFEGFDIGYYFIDSYMKFGKNFCQEINKHPMKLLESYYYFKQTSPDDGFENQYWNIGRFQNYTYLPLQNLYFRDAVEE